MYKTLFKTIIENKKEFLRFCIIGTLSTLSHYGLYFLFQLILNAYVSYTIAYAITFVANFFMSSYYTFSVKPSVKKFSKMILAHLVNYCICMLLLKLFLYVNIKKELAPFPVYAISVPINFLMVRTVFKEKKQAES